MSSLSSLNDRRNRSIQMISEALADNKEFCELPPEDNGYPSEFKVWSSFVETNGKKWEIHVLLTKDFPDQPPQIKVLGGEKLILKIPHVFEDGNLCVIPESSSIDINNPVDLFWEVVESTKKILEGKEVDDFQTEFSVYWNRCLDSGGKVSLLIDSPEVLGTSFDISYSENFIFASISTESLKKWQENFFGTKNQVKSTRNGILVVLDAPLLPKEYPETLSDLVTMLLSINAEEELELLIKLFVSKQPLIFVLLAQKTDNGYALGGVYFQVTTVTNYNLIMSGKQSIREIIDKCLPLMKKTKVTKCLVERIDYSWIHSRGGDGGSFQKRAVLLIGCGSLGGYVAHYLAKAGVSKITIIDHDKLKWANIGRHILGAKFCGRFKAQATALSLGNEMPHLQISWITKKWQDALRDNDKLFDNYDIIVSTIGDWRSEGPLNYISHEIKIPPILFGWLEPYAVAGHCLLRVNGSGCLACEMNRFGQFKYAVTKFQGKTLKREPGECTQYQQYGPAAMLPVVSLIVNEAIRSLNEKPERSELKTWISDREYFWNTDALISPEWKVRIDSKGYSRVHYTSWDSKKDCTVCN